MKSVFILALLITITLQQAQLRFEDFDSDDDGSVTLAEIQQFCHSLDTNNDDAVSFGEFTGGQTSLQHDDLWRAQFDYFDTLGGTDDQHIRCSEAPAAFLSAVDDNGDGEIRKREFEAAMVKINEQVSGVVG